MMALIGFIMISAAGFAEVMKATGDIDSLVAGAFDLFGDNRGLAALVMLLVGLFITLGIGSSFQPFPSLRRSSYHWPCSLVSHHSDRSAGGHRCRFGRCGVASLRFHLEPTSGLNGRPA